MKITKKQIQQIIKEEISKFEIDDQNRRAKRQQAARLNQYLTQDNPDIPSKDYVRNFLQKFKIKTMQDWEEALTSPSEWQRRSIHPSRTREEREELGKLHSLYKSNNHNFIPAGSKSASKRRPKVSDEDIRTAEKKIAIMEKSIIPYVLKNLKRLKIELTPEQIKSELKELKSSLLDTPKEIEKVDNVYSSMFKYLGKSEFRKALSYQSFSDKHFPTFKRLGKALGFEE